MFFRKFAYTLVIILAALLFSGCTSESVLDIGSPQVSENMGFDEVANYISQHNELPPNYITKKEARELGWEPSEGNLHEVAPGKSIGGDVFGNREGLLPKKKAGYGMKPISITQEDGAEATEFYTRMTV